MDTADLALRLLRCACPGRRLGCVRIRRANLTTRQIFRDQLVERFPDEGKRNGDHHTTTSHRGVVHGPRLDEPRLIGTRCTESGTYFFPPETHDVAGSRVRRLRRS